MLKLIGRVGGAILKIPGKLLAKTIGALLPEKAKELIARWGPLASTCLLILAGAGLIEIPALNVLLELLGAPLEHPDKLAEIGAIIAAIVGAAFGVGQKTQNVVDESEGKRDRVATLSHETEREMESSEPKTAWLHQRSRYLVHKAHRPHGEAVLQAMREVHGLSEPSRRALDVLRSGES
jgi:hypothetical protein